MDKRGKAGGRLRTWVQLGFTALSNGYLSGFARGAIYTRAGKSLCLPGLNCYSCPGALGSCPLGSLQAALGERGGRFPLYVVGFLIAAGAVFGRFICGWLCPFGLVQDLLHRIPFPRKLRKLPGDRWLRFLKYGILAGFVIVLPLFSGHLIGQPWFCKYICPSGTLMGGVPLLAANPMLREAAGWLFAWKGLLLAILLVLSVIVYRPFCRYLCPLGAIYGLFNPVALVRIKVDPARCTGCGRCQKTCKLDLPVYRAPNSPDCIRCGECVSGCPQGALYGVHRRGKAAPPCEQGGVQESRMRKKPAGRKVVPAGGRPGKTMV